MINKMSECPWWWRCFVSPCAPVSPRPVNQLGHLILHIISRIWRLIYSCCQNVRGCGWTMWQRGFPASREWQLPSFHLCPTERRRDTCGVEWWDESPGAHPRSVMRSCPLVVNNKGCTKFLGREGEVVEDGMAKKDMDIPFIRDSYSECVSWCNNLFH